MLGSYGGTEFATPNLDAFAARSTRFTRHVTGSLPCIPARHDVLCGSLDFLWRPWGSIELWEDAITRHLATLARAAPVPPPSATTTGTLTGALSTDGGTSWRTVASVPVPGVAATQDVGMFMTATHGGAGGRGTVEFSAWQLP